MLKKIVKKINFIVFFFIVTIVASCNNGDNRECKKDLKDFDKKELEKTCVDLNFEKKNTDNNIINNNSSNIDGDTVTTDGRCKVNNTDGNNVINNETNINIGNISPLVLPVYMDYQATTRIDPRVLQEMNWVENYVYGNANSLHKMGTDALKLVEKARRQVADVIGAKPDEIIFTSGATESNNLALKGMVEAYAKKTGKKHIITSMTEHACIQETCKNLESSKNMDITYLCPKFNGLIDLKELENAITPDTLLISIMGVNNEIGVIQDLEKIGKIAKKHGVFFHTDCAQAYGKIPLDVNKMNIDLMSISGHKIYGPKGIGALYVRQHGKGAGKINNKYEKIDLLPQINGGGQEHGIRSGTLAVPLIVGFGKAAEIMKTDFEKDNKRVSVLSKRLKNGLYKIPDATLNGDEKQRYVGNLNFSFKDVDALTLVQNLGDKVALSIGSACGSSHEAVDSYVIKALGINTEKSGGAVRIGIGRFTTEAEVDYAIKAISEEVKNERGEKNGK